jgi:hypothetical protein
LTNLKEKLADWRDREAHMTLEHSQYVKLIADQKRQLSKKLLLIEDDMVRLKKEKDMNVS